MTKSWVLATPSFMGKCIQRMKSLTGQGATVLFVSHDMGAVQMLCDRAIWLHAGSIREDGPLLPVSKAYLASASVGTGSAVTRPRDGTLPASKTRQLTQPPAHSSLLPDWRGWRCPDSVSGRSSS
ncbi:MAG: hypothetical protein R3E84_02900 [Pseudomonadales bacterium]